MAKYKPSVSVTPNEQIVVNSAEIVQALDRASSSQNLKVSNIYTKVIAVYQIQYCTLTVHNCS